MRVFVLSLLVAGTIAFPNNFKLTPDMVDEAIEKLKDQPKCVPDFVLQQIRSVSTEEKEEFINFVNKVHNGELSNVKDLKDFVQQIRTKFPRIADKAQAIYNEIKSRVENLNEKGKDFVKEWAEKWLTVVKSANPLEPMKMLKGLILFQKDFLFAVENLDSETLNNLKDKFPEQAKVFNECPQLKAYVEFIKKLPPNAELALNEMQQYLMKSALGKMMLPGAVKAA